MFFDTIFSFFNSFLFTQMFLLFFGILIMYWTDSSRTDRFGIHTEAHSRYKSVLFVFNLFSNSKCRKSTRKYYMIRKAKRKIQWYTSRIENRKKNSMKISLDAKIRRRSLWKDMLIRKNTYMKDSIFSWKKNQEKNTSKKAMYKGWKQWIIELSTNTHSSRFCCDRTF